MVQPRKQAAPGALRRWRAAAVRGRREDPERAGAVARAGRSSARTGYDFVGSVNNLFVNGSNSTAFERLYTEFIGRSTDLDNLIIQSKMLVMRDALASEINALSSELERIGERNRHYRDFTLNGINATLREVIACLPVYRTYINAVTGEVPEQDRKFVQMAMRTRAGADRAWPMLCLISSTIRCSCATSAISARKTASA